MPPVSRCIDLPTSPPTKVLITEYSNLVFTIITQVERIGTLVQAWVDNPEDIQENYVYTVQVRFGQRQDAVAETVARALLEIISKTSFKPLVVGVSLSSPLEDVFTPLLTAFQSHFPLTPT